MSDKPKYPIRTVLWVLIIIGFALMEFPGVFLLNRIEPMIFGMPFIYGFTIVLWIFMCLLMLIGYRTNWGKGKDFKEQDDLEGGKA